MLNSIPRRMFSQQTALDLSKMTTSYIPTWTEKSDDRWWWYFENWGLPAVISNFFFTKTISATTRFCPCPQPLSPWPPLPSPSDGNGFDSACVTQGLKAAELPETQHSDPRYLGLEYDGIWRSGSGNYNLFSIVWLHVSLQGCSNARASNQSSWGYKKKKPEEITYQDVGHIILKRLFLLMPTKPK